MPIPKAKNKKSFIEQIHEEEDNGDGVGTVEKPLSVEDASSLLGYDINKELY